MKYTCWICGEEHPDVYKAFGCLNSHPDDIKNNKEDIDELRRKK